MRVMSISQLLCLTKAEILEMRRMLLAQLLWLPDTSIERLEAFETLTNIEIVLARPIIQITNTIKPEV